MKRTPTARILAAVAATAFTVAGVANLMGDTTAPGWLALMQFIAAGLFGYLALRPASTREGSAHE